MAILVMAQSLAFHFCVISVSYSKFLCSTICFLSLIDRLKSYTILFIYKGNSLVSLKFI